MRRIGVFGGTFDPPHVGHLMIAEWARAALRLDRVIFVPAGSPPHKRPGAVTPAAHRLAMTRRAVRGNPAFAVSSIETRRRGPSYTVDTLRALRAEHHGARLFLIVGQDSLDDFATWRDPRVILSLSTLVVAGREGAASAPAAPPRGRKVVRLDNPVVRISSSEMRARMRRGRSVRYVVPDGVAAYAARHRLYRRSP